MWNEPICSDTGLLLHYKRKAAGLNPRFPTLFPRDQRFGGCCLTSEMLALKPFGNMQGRYVLKVYFLWLLLFSTVGFIAPLGFPSPHPSHTSHSKSTSSMLTLGVLHPIVDILLHSVPSLPQRNKWGGGEDLQPSRGNSWTALSSIVMLALSPLNFQPHPLHQPKAHKPLFGVRKCNLC